ncbi:major capsid protein [Capybara microvirus Cap1_SP_87]|nr:major capsid protein [Capybara microvirus Cap1_SP_87]
MAKGFDKMHVKSAVQGHGKFDLSRSHLTTLDFGQIIPVFTQSCTPGDKISTETEIFSRMAPLVFPTYGKAALKTMTAFVPLHQLAEDAEAYVAGKTSWQGATPVLRYFTLDDIFNVFNASGMSVTVSDATESTPSKYDFTYKASASSQLFKRLTRFGRYVYKIMCALGYQIPQGIDLSSGSAWQTQKNVKVSAYPLLAFFKIYNDWMSQSQRFNTSVLSRILLNIRQNKADTTLYATTGQLKYNCIITMFQNLYLQFESDYFTSAWQNPNCALATGEYTSSMSLNGDGSSIVSNYNMNAIEIDGDLSSRALDYLRSFDKWVRRHNYSGSRAVQNIYSQFGIKSDDYRSHFAEVLNVSEQPLQIGDVTSVAQTDGANLGEYAGKGIVDGKSKASVVASDFGYYMTLAWISVKPVYSHGFSRDVLRTAPLDFFHPEFDGLGAQAISYREVYENPKTVSSPNGSAVFGYTENYTDMKYGRDLITGDMRIYDDFKAWHFERDLDAIRKAGNMIAQTNSMNSVATPDDTATLDGAQSEFDRIFSVVEGPEDHFYLTCWTDCTAIRPMKNLNDVADLGTGDLTIERNGNSIN